MPQVERYLPVAEVLQVAGFSRRTLYAEMQRGRFPKPKQISAGRVGWRESDIRQWAESRASA